jgi:hypothetical protein
VLQGPFQYDRALIRNAVVYGVSLQMGHYAPRTRLVEVFLNEDGGVLDAETDYFGVYVLTEKIKRGKNRVNVERHSATIVNPLQASGGYILKVDRADPGDSCFRAANMSLCYVYP